MEQASFFIFLETFKTDKNIWKFKITLLAYSTISYKIIEGSWY